MEFNNIKNNCNYLEIIYKKLSYLKFVNNQI